MFGSFRPCNNLVPPKVSYTVEGSLATPFHGFITTASDLFLASVCFLSWISIGTRLLWPSFLIRDILCRSWSTVWRGAPTKSWWMVAVCALGWYWKCTSRVIGSWSDAPVYSRRCRYSPVRNLRVGGGRSSERAWWISTSHTLDFLSFSSIRLAPVIDVREYSRVKFRETCRPVNVVIEQRCQLESGEITNGLGNEDDLFEKWQCDGTLQCSGGYRIAFLL